jgi:hypothetical protein
MDLQVIFLDVAMTLANYIFVNSITSATQQKAVSDLKANLSTSETQIMSEIKQQSENIINQVKESSEVE